MGFYSFFFEISTVLRENEVENNEFNVVVTTRNDIADTYDFYYKEFFNKASGCDSSPFALLSLHWSQAIGLLTQHSLKTASDFFPIQH